MQNSKIEFGPVSATHEATTKSQQPTGCLAFSDPIQRRIWANNVVNNPSAAFVELMELEQQVLDAKDNPLSCPVETYWESQRLIEMGEMWAAAHPFSDWAVLSDDPQYRLPRLLC
jgi:hypothetical protein